MTKLHKTMYELLSYNYLEADWDGYDSIKPKREKISAAWKLLGVLIDARIPAPSVMISGTSEIGFYWDNKEPKFYAEIGLDNDDTTMFYGFLSKGEDEYSGQDDVKFEDFKNTDICKFLRENLGELKLDNFEEYYYGLFTSKEII